MLDAKDKLAERMADHLRAIETKTDQNAATLTLIEKHLREIKAALTPPTPRQSAPSTPRRRRTP